MTLLYTTIHLDYTYKDDINNNEIELELTYKDNLYMPVFVDTIDNIYIEYDNTYTITNDTRDDLNHDLKTTEFAFTLDTYGHDSVEGLITSDNNLPAKGTAYLFYKTHFINETFSDEQGIFRFNNINGNLKYNIEVKLDDSRYDGKVVYDIVPTISVKIPVLNVMNIVSAWPQLYRNSKMKYVVKISNYEGSIELSMVPSYGWIINKNNDTYTLEGSPNIPDDEYIFRFTIKIINTVLDGTINIYDYEYSHGVVKGVSSV